VPRHPMVLVCAKPLVSSEGGELGRCPGHPSVLSVSLSASEGSRRWHLPRASTATWSISECASAVHLGRRDDQLQDVGNVLRLDEQMTHQRCL
jgi:hypothetical protein